MVYLAPHLAEYPPIHDTSPLPHNCPIQPCTLDTALTPQIPATRVRPDLPKRQRVQARLLLRLPRPKDEIGQDGYKERETDEQGASEDVERVAVARGDTSEAGLIYCPAVYEDGDGAVALAIVALWTQNPFCILRLAHTHTAPVLSDAGI